MIPPLLSVCIITYNHEEYIRDAIEGVLMQKVNFNYEIIIADDYSTDNTRKIILGYSEIYPNIFKLIFQEKNVGAAQNWLDLISFPKSKYIAYFEGDDYWTDPNKLQKQVDFLETSPEYSLCFHNAYVKSNIPESEGFFNKFTKNKAISLEEVIEWVIPSSSIVFRGSILPLPAWSKMIYSGDMTLALIAFMNGKLYSMRDCMSVYRHFFNNDSLTARSRTFKSGYVQDQHILLYTFFDQETKGIHREIIEKHILFLKSKKTYLKLKQRFGYAALMLVPGYVFWRISGKKR